MNCKPGDLAYIVWSVCGNEGMVVRCIRSAGVFRFPDGTTGLCWETDHDFGPDEFSGDEYRHCAPDDQLKPITPPPGSVTEKEVRELYQPRKNKEPA